MAERAPTSYADLGPEVFAQIIAPDFKEEMQDVVTWRHRWRKIASWVEGLAHVVTGVSAILAFAAGFFNLNYLSFAAGCSMTLCTIMLRFSTYANGESIERNNILGRLLSSAGLGPTPSIASDPEVPAPATSFSTASMGAPVLNALVASAEEPVAAREGAAM